MTGRGYTLETAFLILTIGISIAGFWTLYFGPEAAPNAFHHLHLVTSFAWLALLLVQLRLMSAQRINLHRRVGRLVLILAPLLIASAALLSVNSAARALGSGQADPLIIQNVGVTIQLAILLLLAFAMIGLPRLHGALLLSTALLFMGIALVFALVSFVPAFRIEGPDTFDRFAQAAMTATAFVGACAFVLFIKDYRNGWPYLIPVLFIVANGLIDMQLSASGETERLTAIVGAWNRYVTFLVAFFSVLGGLIALGVGRKQRGARSLNSITDTKQ